MLENYISSIFQAKSRAELVRVRQEALDQFLADNPEFGDNFAAALCGLNSAVEGREDLSWTIHLFDTAWSCLRANDATPEVEAEFLLAYAGALSMHAQNVRAKATLDQALRVAPVRCGLRLQLLDSMANTCNSLGEAGDAELARIEACNVATEPTDRTYHLWTLAEHYVGYENKPAAQRSMDTLVVYLNETPNLPIDALSDGWDRVAMFGEEHGEPRDAVTARWARLAVHPKEPSEQSLILLTQVYDAASPLPAEERMAVAARVLEVAHSIDGEPFRISMLLELASSDLIHERKDLATQHFDAARKAIEKLGESATKSDRKQWKIRQDDLTRSFAKADYGETVWSTKPVIRLLDEDGEVISSPHYILPPDVAALHQLYSTPEAEAEAALMAMVEKFTHISDAPECHIESLKTRIEKIEREPLEEFDGFTWTTIIDAIREGEASWAEQFLKGELQRELNRYAHPFHIESVMGSLLDALAAQGAWDEGRAQLAWWRGTIESIDHPESYRLDRNFDAEAEWEIRAGNFDGAKRIRQRQIDFVGGILGANSVEVKRLRARANL